MQIAFKVSDILSIVNPLAVKGVYDKDAITGIASLSEAKTGDLSFLGNPKYKSEVPGTAASIILLPKDYTGEPNPGQQYLFVENPSAALALVCLRIEQSLWTKPTAGIHPTAVISGKAKVASSASIGAFTVIEEGSVVGENSVIESHSFIGKDVVIGSQCWFLPRVTIYNGCTIGDRVQIHSGVVVGADGFGYEFTKGRHVKVPQVGTVRIGNDVEIGANSTIDRARFGETSIDDGTKIDNLVQIGHNTRIGKHCILCAQVGIAGSTIIEDYVVLGGQVGVAGHLTLGRGFKAAAQTGIPSSQPAGTVAWGTPCLPYSLEQRLFVLKQRLPDLFARVGDIEKTLGITKKTFSKGKIS